MNRWFIFKAREDDAECYVRGKWYAVKLGTVGQDYIPHDTWVQALEQVNQALFVDKLKTRVETPKAPVARGDWNAYP